MKNTLYWSLNEAEMALMLNTLDADEAQLYLVLKKRANFRTGDVGTFKNEKLNLQKLADVLARPSRQGKAALIFHRKDVQRMLDKLRDRGLVADMRIDDDRLMMRLPLSPIRYAGDVATAVSEGESESLPLDETPNALETRMKSGASKDSLNTSVLTRSKNYQSSSISIVSNGGVEGSAKCADASSTSSCEAPAPSTRTGLTVQQMEERMLRRGFRLLRYEYSRQLLAEWEAMELAGSDFEDALTVLESDPKLDRVPAALDCVLRPRNRPNQSGGRKSAFII
jgi:hypothetical protein